MTSDPNPQNAIGRIDPDGAVMLANTHRPNSINALQLKRGMAGIVFQNGKILIGDVADFIGKGFIQSPEIGRSGMVHSSRTLP